MADIKKMLDAAQAKEAPAATAKQIYQMADSAKSDFLAQNFSIRGALANAGAAATASEKPNDAVYDKAQPTVGALRQVERIDESFVLARQGILDLREELANARSDGTHSLLRRIADYLAKPGYSTQVERDEVFPGFFPDKTKPTDFVLPNRPKIADPGDDTDFTTTREVTKDGSKVTETVRVKHTEHSALFATGRVMTNDIKQLDALRRGFTVLRRRRQLALAQKQAALAAVLEKIPPAQAKLNQLDAVRQEALGDHAVAARLLAEHWAALEQAWQARRQILEHHQGLYYVRVRETPLSRTLPDPLELRHTDADDIVPGCSGDITEIPPALSPFLAAVHDVPLADWAALAALHVLLPERTRLEALVRQRRERLAKPREPADGSALAGRLRPLQQETQALTRELMQLPFAGGGALSAVQQQSARLLALDDLLTGPPHRLRGPAAALHQRLGNAAACLAQRLRAIPPSLRLDWAEAAENDRLPVESPERWPGLDRAEASDFNGVRTLVELVHWWFRQLRENASGGARTALRNYLRAAVLHAASDDPGQLLRGNVATLPGRFRTGEMLRLKLNREAAPGALLSLIAPDQRVVGTLRVDDFDEHGAVAVITQVLDAKVEPQADWVQSSTAWQVLGKTR